MGRYLDMLKDIDPSKHSEPTFYSSNIVAFPSKHVPPLDRDVPCGLCPTCGQGEFWRPSRTTAVWRCWFCSPPPEGWGVRDLDFAGVPDASLNRRSERPLMALFGHPTRN
jgi:hypothetical protein